MLDDDDPVLRAQGEARLLATALTDLLVGLYLYGVAQGGQEPPPGAEAVQARDFGAGGAPAAPAPDWQPSREEIEDTLRTLTADAPKAPAAAGSASAAPAEARAARFKLAGEVVDTILAIRSETVAAGQTVFNGLLGIGAGAVAEAAGQVGLNIARASGEADKALQIYDLFREFAFRSYEALMTLIGTHMAQATADQVVAWLAQLRSGEELGRLLDRTYGIHQLGAKLGDLVASSQASPEKFTAAALALATLRTHYDTQTNLVRRLLRGLVLFGIAPAIFLPEGGWLLAAAFIALTGYIVLAGADFLDAPGYQPLDRVPGVRHIVEQALCGKD
jgi:hypothetical protein